MPVWGAVLSDPLPVVGTAGRRPAVYLMGRMPIPRRIAPFHREPCGSRSYGESIPLSGGCAPAGGRSHTRYAPGRRSPAQCCHCPLPLDLHVLGLPLAFILSQDQTLRCMTFFLLFPRARRAGGSRRRARLPARVVRLSFCPLPMPQCPSPPLAALRAPGRSSLPKASAKVVTIDNWQWTVGDYFGVSRVI